MSWLQAQARACCEQGLSTPVPADAGFAQRKGVWRMAIRTLRRRLQLRLSGQQPLRLNRLPPGCRRLLWIHEGMPQIGDALMDLAPRSLLSEQGIEVDLLAPPHLAELFAGDRWFSRVMPFGTPPDSPDAAAGRYDAVLLLSDDRRSWQLKRALYPRLPWLSLQGLYNGPDFHRARFAAQRLADVLGLALTPPQLAAHAAQKLVPDATALSWAQQQLGGTRPVLLALGGVAADRRWRHWPALLQALRQAGLRHWVLVGSANGRDDAAALKADVPEGDLMIDLVGLTSLKQVQALAAQAVLFIGCDGGLMHLALTTGVPVLGLFNQGIAPDWRLPEAALCRGLQSPSASVDGLGAQQVARAALDLLQAAQSLPPMP